MEPLVSIIVPVYNVERYLKRCLDSIVNQTYKNLEIILVNDGSTDNSKAICKEYASQDPRIIVIDQKNSGSSIARNKGLDASTGDVIGFIDSDDYVDQSLFSKMIQLMNQHNLDVVEVELFYTDSKKNYNDSFIIQDSPNALKRVLDSESFSVWRRIYKKSLVGDLRFIPKIIHQDVFYTIDVLNKVSKVGYLNTPLYIYNTENTSIIRSKYTSKKVETGIRATEYILNNIPSDKAVKRSANNYLVRYYTVHYFLLVKNRSVDHLKEYRKKLKKAILKSLNIENINFRSFLIVTLPIGVIEFLVSKLKIS